MHIYQLLPYGLSTSFSTHPKPLTWDKKPFQSRRVHFFDTENFLLFSALWDWFFSDFFYCSSHQSLIFCNRMDVQKIPKRPPFTFFGTMRLTGNFKKIPKKNSEFCSQFLVFWELLLCPVVEKVDFVFLSLRYGADLGRSRLVIILSWIIVSRTNC